MTSDAFLCLNRTALDSEIHALQAPFSFWWRDDDAVAATPALHRLLAQGERFDASIALAVIPANLEASLPRSLSDTATIVFAHGWRHANHAPADQKKAEFGAHRPLETRLGEAREAISTCRAAFADQLVPVFTPPWNRIGSDLLPHLSSIGYRAVSTYGPRREKYAADSLMRLNAHIDPINWRGDRSLAPPQTLIYRLTSLLKNRREGRSDPNEPIGLLTHHRVQDDAVFSFSEDLLSYLTDRSAVRFTDIRSFLE